MKNLMDKANLSRILAAQNNSPRLTLNDCFLGDQGIKLIIPFLSEHPRISVLELKGNNISPSGFAELCDYLKFHSKLSSLICEWNNIGLDETGIESLKILVQFNRSLIHVDLRNNKIGINEAAAIGDLLKNNTSLLSLDLRWNEIRNQGMVHILDGMKDNLTLLYLEAQGNNISGENLKTLEFYLRRNREENPIPKEKILSVAESETQRAVLKEKEINHIIEKIENSAVKEQAQYLGKLQETLKIERKVNMEINERLDSEIERLRNQEIEDERFIHEYDLKMQRIELENDGLRRGNGLLKSDVEALQFGALSSLKNEDKRAKAQDFEVKAMESEHRSLLEKRVDEHNRLLNQLKVDWEDKLSLLETRVRDIQAIIIELEGMEKGLADEINEKTVRFDEAFKRFRGNRIEDEEFIKFYKLHGLEAKISKTRFKLMSYIRRNGALMNELKAIDEVHAHRLQVIDSDLANLKQENEVFAQTKQDFILLMDKLKLEASLKSSKLEKLEGEVEAARERLRKKQISGQKERDHESGKKEEEKRHWQEQKGKLLGKIAELERDLADISAENTRLKGEGARLIQALQSSVSKTVYEVFSVNKFI